MEEKISEEPTFEEEDDEIPLPTECPDDEPLTEPIAETVKEENSSEAPLSE